MPLNTMSCLASPHSLKTLSSLDVKKYTPPPMRVPSDLGGKPNPDGPYLCLTKAPSGNTSHGGLARAFLAPGFRTRFVLNGVVAAAAGAALSRTAKTMADEASSVVLTPRRRDREPTTSSPLLNDGGSGIPGALGGDSDWSPADGQACSACAPRGRSATPRVAARGLVVSSASRRLRDRACRRKRIERIAFGNSRHGRF